MAGNTIEVRVGDIVQTDVVFPTSKTKTSWFSRVQAVKEGEVVLGRQRGPGNPSRIERLFVDPADTRGDRTTILGLVVYGQTEIRRGPIHKDYIPKTMEWSTDV